MSLYWASCQIHCRSQRLPNLWWKQALGIRKRVFNHEGWVSQKRMLNEMRRMNTVEPKADTNRVPSHFSLSWTHIQQPYWCVTAKAWRVPFYCLWGQDPAPQTWLPNCALADFAGDLQHFEGDIYKKQQLPLRNKAGRSKKCCSPQRHITPAAHLPLSFCQHANLGERWPATPAWQVAEPLMTLLPRVMREASELFPFIQIVTVPQSQLQITLCLFWSLVLCF